MIDTLKVQWSVSGEDFTLKQGSSDILFISYLWLCEEDCHCLQQRALISFSMKVKCMTGRVCVRAIKHISFVFIWATQSEWCCIYNTTSEGRFTLSICLLLHHHHHWCLVSIWLSVTLKLSLKHWIENNNFGYCFFLRSLVVAGERCLEGL